MHQKIKSGHFLGSRIVRDFRSFVSPPVYISGENCYLGCQGNKCYSFSIPKQTFKVLPNSVLSMEVTSLHVGTEHPGGMSGPGGRGPEPWGHSLNFFGLPRPLSCITMGEMVFTSPCPPRRWLGEAQRSHDLSKEPLKPPGSQYDRGWKETMQDAHEGWGGPCSS